MVLRQSAPSSHDCVALPPAPPHPVLAHCTPPPVPLYRPAVPQVYKRVLDKPVAEKRMAGICQRENSFYVDTVRAFRCGASEKGWDGGMVLGGELGVWSEFRWLDWCREMVAVHSSAGTVELAAWLLQTSVLPLLPCG